MLEAPATAGARPLTSDGASMAISPAQERIDTAIRLGKPDRVPVVPMMDCFAARYSGVTQHDMLFDIRSADAAFDKVHRDLGPIDGFNMSNGGMAEYLLSLAIVPPLLPGVDGADENAQWQFVERTVMTPEEYPAFAAGPFRFIMNKALEYNPAVASPYVYWRNMARGQLTMLKVQYSTRAWRRKGIEPIVGANLALHPLEQFTMGLRSCTDFVTDLFRYPDELMAASRALLKAQWPTYLVGPRVSGIKRAFIGLTRTSATIMSPKQFEKFSLPELHEICDHLLAHDVTPLLHCDNDWTPFLEYFKDFPRGKCICNLDGSTDIFKAREVLGDHMCIMGDVPATLLTLGEPDEVDAYCERLIREIGSDGGFILSTGCDTPVDAKPENVKAMLRSVHRHRV
jgi:hypothetical protein